MTRVLAKYSRVRQGASPCWAGERPSSSDSTASSAAGEPLPASGGGWVTAVFFTAEKPVAQEQRLLSRHVKPAGRATHHRLRRRLVGPRGRGTLVAALHRSPDHIDDDRQQQEEEYASHH